MTTTHEERKAVVEAFARLPTEAARLRFLASARGVTLTELGRTLGRPVWRVQRVLSGATRPFPNELEDIRRVLLPSQQR